MAVNDRDGIVVTELLNHRVSVFRSGRTYLRSFGENSEKNGEFNQPSGIALDSHGNSERGAKRLVKANLYDFVQRNVARNARGS